MNHHVVVILFSVHLAFVSGQEDMELKTSCLLQHQVDRQRQLQMSDGEVNVGAHAEYLRSALVMVKELASNVTKWDTNLSKSERDALDLIKDFIADLEKSAANSHGEDQREVNRSKGLIVECSSTAKKSLAADVAPLKTRMEDSRQNHNTCRTSEADCQKSEDSHCAEWDTYRKLNVPNTCAGVDFKDQINTAVPATKASMEQCLRELQPFYLKQIECWKYGECVDKIAPLCDNNQTKFEGDYCDYSRQLSRTCEAQTDCRKKHISFRNATHTDVAANEAARKADYITSQMVLCYFKVFESNNTNKSATLRGCEQLTVNTTHLNINYPAIPGARVCVVEKSKPCDADWVSAEYDTKQWKARVTMLDCAPCPADPVTPQPPRSYGNALSFETARNLACAVMSNNELHCSGSAVAYIGFNENDATKYKWEKISIGYRSLCGILVDKTVKCFGLGEGYGWDGAPGPDEKFIDISSSYDTSCGVKVDRTLKCWGKTAWDDRVHTVPTTNNGKYDKISMPHFDSMEFACATLTDGTAECWGNFHPGDSGKRPGNNYQSLVAWHGLDFGLKTDGTISITGPGGPWMKDFQPFQGKFVQITAGYWNACALVNDGQVVCVGNHRRLARAKYADWKPGAPLAPRCKRISIGEYHLMCQLMDGTMKLLPDETCPGGCVEGSWTTPPQGSELYKIFGRKVLDA